MSYEWYDDIKKCNEKEKAMILEYAYAFHMGEDLPKSDDRFINRIFEKMNKYFGNNKIQYEKRCIDNSLIQKLSWAKRTKNKEKENQIEKQRRYLETHSIQEYTQVYGSIQNYTDYDNEYENETDNDNDSEIEIDNEYE